MSEGGEVYTPRKIVSLEHREGSLIKQLYDAHLSDLGPSLQNEDFFNLNPNSERTESLYRNLTVPQINELVDDWINGDTQDLQESYDKRVTGRFLQTLVDIKTAEVLEALQDDYKKQDKPGEDLERVARITTLLCATSDADKLINTNDGLSHEPKHDPFEYTGRYGRTGGQALIDLMRMGIIVSPSNCEVLGTGMDFGNLLNVNECSALFTQTKDEDVIALKSFRNHLETFNLGQEDLARSQAYIGMCIIKSEKMGGIYDHDPDAIHSLGDIQGDALEAIYADTDTGLMPSSVKELIQTATYVHDVDETGLLLTIVDQSRAAIHPNSLFAQTLSRMSFSELTIAKLIKRNLDRNQGAWVDDQDSFITRWVSEQLTKNPPDYGHILLAATPCLGYGTELPRILQEYLTKLEQNEETIDIGDYIRYRRLSEADEWADSQNYPIDWRTNLLQHGLSVFPLELKLSLDRSLSLPENRGKFTVELLKAIGEEYEYRLDPSRCPVTDYWKQFSKDLWEIISSSNTRDIMTGLGEIVKLKNGEMKIRAMNVDGDISLFDFFPPEVVNTLSERLSVAELFSQGFEGYIFFSSLMGVGFEARFLKTITSDLLIDEITAKTIYDRCEQIRLDSNGMFASLTFASNMNLGNLITDEAIERFTPEGQRFWKFIRRFNGRNNGEVIQNELLKYIPEIQNLLATLHGSEAEGALFNLLVEKNQGMVAALIVEGWGRDSWKQYLGEDNFRDFIKCLPRSGQGGFSGEDRNAFTHTEYDRTSPFVSFLIRNCTDDLRMIGQENFSRVVGEYVKHHGLNRSQLHFHYFSSLRLKELGIQKILPADVARSGIESLDDLENRTDSVRRLVYGRTPLLPETIMVMSDFEKALLITITGKNSHTFENGRPTFEQIIQQYQSDLKAGLIDVNVNGYKPETVTLQNKEIVFQKERVQNEYNQLRGEILAGMTQPGTIYEQHRQLSLLLEQKATEINLTLQQSSGIKAGFIQDQLARIQSVQQQLTIVGTVDEMLKLLLTNRFDKSDLPTQHSMLRTMLFKKLFQRHHSPQMIENLRVILEQDSIEAQSLLAVLNVVDEMVKEHLVNVNNNNREKYWSEDMFAMLSEKSSRETVSRLFGNASKIRSEVKMFEEVTSTGSVTVDMVPDHGVIGEMAGYLGNVCYTKVFPLLSGWPVTPYKFIAYEQGEPSFIGSVLVFEVKDSVGNNCLMIRAFDVQQESLYPVKDIIDSFITKLENVAQARGAGKIIMAGTNGTISNYPMTTSYFQSKYKSDDRKVPLGARFTFNGYDITDECYLVKEIKSPQVDS
jgi:hypothetical protein